MVLGVRVLSHERVQQTAVPFIDGELSEKLLADHVETISRCDGQHHAQVEEVELLELAETAPVQGGLLLGLGGLRVVDASTATDNLLVGLVQRADFVF